MGASEEEHPAAPPAAPVEPVASGRPTRIWRIWPTGALGDRDRQIAILLAVGVAAAYLTGLTQPQPYDYFMRLADAFLHGRIYLTEAPSWLNELVPRNGHWYVVYPPMPAVMLLPFVAIFGPGLPQQLPNALFGGVAVGLLWLVLGEFRLTDRARALLTFSFAFGSVFWYVTATGSAWYVSHTVAVLFAVAALLPALRRRAPWLVGLLVGCAAISRLPVALTAPFYLALLLDLGWPPRLPADRRAAVRTTLLFGLGMALPVLLYGLYNLARWGTPIDLGYVLIPGILADQFYLQGIFNLQYIPRQLFAIFLRTWNYVDRPPFVEPSWWGLGLFFTTPLLLWLVRARLQDRRVAYAAIGIGLALIPILTHGNVGVAQFGYRFSLDVQPLLWVILATVFERGVSRLALIAGLLAIAINAYAAWAISIGFVAY